MFTLDKQKTPRFVLNREPEMYAIRIFRLNEPLGSVIIWESFSNEIAKTFSLQERVAYFMLKKVAVNGCDVQFGEYTKDVALTRISNAVSVCCKYKTAIKLDFGAIKL